MNHFLKVPFIESYFLDNFFFKNSINRYQGSNLQCNYEEKKKALKLLPWQGFVTKTLKNDFLKNAAKGAIPNFLKFNNKNHCQGSYFKTITKISQEKNCSTSSGFD